MKGYTTMSMQVTIPSDGSGLVYDFVLPCSTCTDSQGQAEVKTAEVREEVMGLSLRCPHKPSAQECCGVMHHTVLVNLVNTVCVMLPALLARSAFVFCCLDTSEACTGSALFMHQWVLCHVSCCFQGVHMRTAIYAFFVVTGGKHMDPCSRYAQQLFVQSGVSIITAVSCTISVSCIILLVLSCPASSLWPGCCLQNACVAHEVLYVLQALNWYVFQSITWLQVAGYFTAFGYGSGPGLADCTMHVGAEQQRCSRDHHASVESE